MLSRRQFVQASITAGAALALERLRHAGIAFAADGPQARPPLTPCTDPLGIPPVLRPSQVNDGVASLRIRLRAASIRLHSELPLTPVWGYEGCAPGPTIEVNRGQRLRVEYVNDLPGDAEFPVKAVTAPKQTQNSPGCEGREADAKVAALRPW